MAFTCSKEWHELELAEHGRSCGSCQQTVIDFTNWDQRSLMRFYREAPGTCGRFSLEQVDQDMIPLDELGKSVRRGLAITLASLTLGMAQAQQTNHDPATMEQVSLDPSDPTPIEDAVHEEVTGVIPVFIPKLPATEAVQPSTHRWFISTRFPFLHRVRRFRVIGCPSF